jgi:hypothetical protein
MPQSRALAVNKILKQGCADERDLTMAEARGKIVREHMPENYTVRTYKSSVRSVSPASVGRGGNGGGGGGGGGLEVHLDRSVLYFIT